MKKILSLSLILLTLAFFGFVDTAAQTVKKIQFPRCKSSATVRDVTGDYGVYYTLRVKGGQKMALNLLSKDVGIKVERDGGTTVLLRDERSGAYEVYFEEDGEVSIFVGSTSGKSVPFTLNVKIARMTDI